MYPLQGQNKMQGIRSPSSSPIGCNLCGSGSAAVRCDKCQSMAFCLSCDDMYHRHPKRRFHLRKALVLEMPQNYNNASKSLSLGQRSHFLGDINVAAHPSKMPIPPPRRKRKGFTLSGLKDTITNSGNILRRFVTHDKAPPKQTSPPMVPPMITKPMETINGQNSQQLIQRPQNSQQLVQRPQNQNSNPNETRVIHSLFRPRPVTPVDYRKDKNEEIHIPPPPPPKHTTLQSTQIYENCRKGSLPSDPPNVNRPFSPRVISTSSGDLSPQQWSNVDAQQYHKPLKTHSLQRRNHSLHDLPVDSEMTPESYHHMYHHQFVPAPYPHYYMHPWGGSSLTNSMEELQIDDDDDDDDNDSGDEIAHGANSRGGTMTRGGRNRFKKSQMKRSHSAFQMAPSPIPWQPMVAPPPPYYYYYYPPPQFAHPPPSPPASVRSMSLRKRSTSFDGASSASSSRNYSTESHRGRSKSKPKVPEYVGSERSEVFSDSGPMTSSSQPQSESEDDDQFYSAGNEGSDNDNDGVRPITSKWACRYCTYINDPSENICVMCCKTHQRSKKSKNSIRKLKPKNDSLPKGDPLLKSKKSHHPKIEDERKFSSDSGKDYVFDDDLIREQKEVERELIRRLENERRIDKENERIQRREELMRRKNLGLPIGDLADRVKKDEEEEEKEKEKTKSKNQRPSDTKSEPLKSQIQVKDNESNNKDQKINNNDIKNEIQSLKSIQKPEKTEIGICTDPEKADIGIGTDPQMDSVSSTTITKTYDKYVTPPVSPLSTAPSGDILSSGSVSNPLMTQYHPNYQQMDSNDQNSFQNQNHFMPQTQQHIVPQQFQNQIQSHQMIHQQSSHPNQYPNPISQSQSGPSLDYFQDNRRGSLGNNQRPFGTSPHQYRPLQSDFSMGFTQLPQQYPNYGSLSHLDQMVAAPIGFQSLHNPNVNNQRMTGNVNGNSGSGYVSCEDISGPMNQTQTQRGQQMESLQLIQLLRDAEGRGFTADDVEVAINFNPTKPLEWLEENWANMVETVLTLSNNQIMQNEKKKGTKKGLHTHLISEKDAKGALRMTKGNIWHAIETCVKRKDEKRFFTDAKSSFSMRISGLGSGKENNDSNFIDAEEQLSINSDEEISIDDRMIDISGEEYDDEDDHTDNNRQIIEQIKAKSANDLGTVKAENDVLIPKIRECDSKGNSLEKVCHVSSRENFKTRHAMQRDKEQEKERKKIDALLENWKKEKEDHERERVRRREQEKEKQRMRKILELQKKMSEYDSDDDEDDDARHEPDEDAEEEDLEVAETFSREMENSKVWNEIGNQSDERDTSDDDENGDKEASEESEIHWEVYSGESGEEDEEIKFIDDQSDGQPIDDYGIVEDEVFVESNDTSDVRNDGEYYSDDDDNAHVDEFERINTKMQIGINEIQQQMENNIQITNKDNNNIINNKTINEMPIISASQDTNHLKNQQKNDHKTESKESNNQLKSKNTNEMNTNAEESVSKQIISVSKSQMDSSEDDLEEERKQYLLMMEECEKEYAMRHSEDVPIKDMPKNDAIDESCAHLRAEARQILQEIDESLKQSLDDLELMEKRKNIKSVNSNDSNIKCDNSVVTSEGLTLITNQSSIVPILKPSLQLPIFCKEKGSDKLCHSSLLQMQMNSPVPSDDKQNMPLKEDLIIYHKDHVITNSEQNQNYAQHLNNTNMTQQFVNQSINVKDHLLENPVKDNAKSIIMKTIDDLQQQQTHEMINSQTMIPLQKEQFKENKNIDTNVSNIKQNQNTNSQLKSLKENNEKMILHENSKINDDIKDNNNEKEVLNANGEHNNEQMRQYSQTIEKCESYKTMPIEASITPRTKEDNEQSVKRKSSKTSEGINNSLQLTKGDDKLNPKNYITKNNDQLNNKGIDSKVLKDTHGSESHTKSIANDSVNMQQYTAETMKSSPNEVKVVHNESLEKSVKAKDTHKVNTNKGSKMKGHPQQQSKHQSLNKSHELKGLASDQNQEIPKTSKQQISGQITDNNGNNTKNMPELGAYGPLTSESSSYPKPLYPDTSNANFEWARTQYECELCTGTYGIKDMVALISCTHCACRECLQQYFTIQIREMQQFIIVCPFCDEPNIDADDDENIFEYLGLLEIMIKHLVENDIFELFQRKVRDRALMRDPNFRWCTKCSSGFIVPNPQALTVMCPDCGNLTCAHCRKTWKKQHFGITCEQFAEWELSMDPEFAASQLDKHLQEFGIDCPNCKFRYQLAKGGCMHFHCVQCNYDFCGGCKRPFKMGKKCGVSNFCEKLGLHAHHPRNCLFYLRDKEPTDLQKLLDTHRIQYKTHFDTESKSKTCSVMEQKKTVHGMKDESCGRYIATAGLCRLHYIEYLGNLISKHHIDPIVIFKEDELELVLKRANIRLPVKSNDQEYKEILINMIQEQLPLQLTEEITPISTF